MAIETVGRKKKDKSNEIWASLAIAVFIVNIMLISGVFLFSDLEISPESFLNESWRAIANFSFKKENTDYLGQTLVVSLFFSIVWKFCFLVLFFKTTKIMKKEIKALLRSFVFILTIIFEILILLLINQFH